MAHLLDLPREVLHMIIGQVILDPSAHSPDVPTTTSNRVLFPPGWTGPTRIRFTPFCPSLWPKLPPFQHALLQTSSVLRYETLYRAKILNSHVHLTIDRSLLSNGRVRNTWLSRPHGKPAAWKRIENVNITLRLPPVQPPSMPPKMQTTLHIEALLTAIRDLLAVIVYPSASKRIGRLTMRVIGSVPQRAVQRAFLNKFSIETSIVGLRTKHLLSLIERVEFVGEGEERFDWKIWEMEGRWMFGEICLDEM